MRLSATAPAWLVAAVLLAPAEAAAAPGDCVFNDTSGTNTSYTEGPGDKVYSSNTWGVLYAEIYVDSEDADGTWGKATHRVNGPRHTLSAGTWSVTFEYRRSVRDIQSGPGAPVEAVSRLGAQVEHFSGSPNVYLSGDQREISNVSDAHVQEDSGTFVITIDVARSAEYGGLFYVDSHARPEPGSWAVVGTSMEVVSICWRHASNTGAGTMLQSRLYTAREVGGP